MDVPHADHDSKKASHIKEASWSEDLLKDGNYKSLVALWSERLAKMEEELHDVSLLPEFRDRIAHQIYAFKLAMDTLAEHHKTHMKLYLEEERKEAPDAPKKQPVL